MASGTSASVIRHVATLLDTGSLTGLPDSQLLDRFIAGRDAAGEAAFAALVARHGPMVLKICRDLLADRHHAEDAFQAVFLVLAQKAPSLRDPDLLPNWLYGVAIHTSRSVKRRLSRPGVHEEPGSFEHTSSNGSAPSAEELLARSEHAELLHAEIERLPQAFRLPVVLCYLEGLTIHEAAKRLRCSHGTVRSRMARARQKLKRALIRCGIVMPATAITAALSTRTAPAAVSASLCDATTRHALSFVAGQSAGPITLASDLAHEALRTMFYQKLKVLALATLLLGTLTASAVFLGAAFAKSNDPTASPPAAAQPPNLKSKIQNLKSPTGRMFVAGRVLDPRGKPVPGATVMLHARNFNRPLPTIPGVLRNRLLPLGDARTNASGQFRIEAPRTSSFQYFGDLCAVAHAPGHGTAWADLDVDADEPSADITLRPEQIIQGRLLDLQGAPVPDVTVSVRSISRNLPPSPIPGRSSFQGVDYRQAQPNELPAWPKSVKTSREGRFTLRGVGRDLRVRLSFLHPRFAPHQTEIVTDGTSESQSLSATLVPAQIITGRVTDADTGKGVPRARLDVGSHQGKRVVLSEFETDAEGRFRITPPFTDGRFGVTAYPPQGQPYLTAASRSVEWPKAALEQSLDLALPRGVSIRGKVTEKSSGKPVPGAIVRFAARPTRRHSFLMRVESTGVSMPTSTAADGSFQLGAEPAPGYLLVKGPTEDYVSEVMGERLFQNGGPGGTRIYTHASVALDLKPGVDANEIHLALRRGLTVTGQVVAPDGQPAQDAWIISRIILDPVAFTDTEWLGRIHGNVHNGRFELHGLDPDVETPVYFLDPRRKLGAMVNLSAKSIALMTLANRAGRAGAPGSTIDFSADSMVRGPIRVRLEPCGAAEARLVDPDGKPLEAPIHYMVITLVVTPGPTWSRAPDQAPLLLADEARLNEVDPINYEYDRINNTFRWALDPDGRVTLPCLIPGATYRIIDYTLRRQVGAQVRKEFTVKPGEILDLGDVVVGK